MAKRHKRLKTGRPPGGSNPPWDSKTLAKWMKENGVGAVGLALLLGKRGIGVSQWAVYSWRQERRSPASAVRRALEKLMGLTRGRL